MRHGCEARRAPRLFPAVAGLVCVAVTLGSCSKRITTVDETFTMPEGTFQGDSAQLVVWPEVPILVRTYQDNSPPGPTIDEFCGQITPGQGDVLIGSVEFRRRSPGSINGMIFDRTQGTSYQMFRRESGGGYRRFQDFVIAPLRRWLNSEWELYAFTDPAPSGFRPPSYVGRGVVRGAVSRASPLTNVSESVLPTIADIGYAGICNPCDSLFTMRWRRVPGARQYWVHVYVFGRTPDTRGMMESGTAAPMNYVGSRDVFLGFVSGAGGGEPDTSYKLKGSGPNVTRLVETLPNFNITYMVRIAAVNDRGQLIAYSRGDMARVTGEGTYQLFPLGAYMVTPKSDPLLCRREE